MSPKRPNPMEDPPTASSSEEEEEVSMDEDEEEDETHKEKSSSDEEADDGDDREVSVKNPLSASAKPGSASAVTIAVPGKTVAPPKQASDSDSGSETETDSDSDTDRRERVAVKPVEQNPESVKAKPSDALASSAKSAVKRPSKTARPPNDVKRVRKEGGTPGEDTKKTYFQRLWSEDDEIAVLKGIIDFKSDTGVSPFDDINGFYELAKKSISFDVSKVQFMDKIRSLRKKYVNNLGKGKNGEDPSFVKAHERKAFELSKAIWGPEGMANESAMKSNGKSKKSQKGKMKSLESLKQELFPSHNGKREELDAEEIASRLVSRSNGFETMLVKAMAGFGVDELAVKQGWAMVSSEDKKRIEEKWNALRAAEIEFLVEKSEFIHEASKLIAETLGSSSKI